MLGVTRYSSLIGHFPTIPFLNHLVSALVSNNSYHLYFEIAPFGRAGSPLPAALNGALGERALPSENNAIPNCNWYHSLSGVNSEGVPPDSGRVRLYHGCKL